MDGIAAILANASSGLGTALAPANLMYCFFGVFIGTAIGVIPGIGAVVAISMLLPVTFHLDATSALIMLAGIWYGTSYGGSIASILLNVPGTPATAVTALDGYPMAREGRAGIALFVTAIASIVGGSIGILLMMFFAPTLASYALQLGPHEYFALLVLALVSASTIGGGSPVKGLAMTTLGLLIGTVGLDLNTGLPRFTFGTSALMEGVSIVALAMGLFGVAEIAGSIRPNESVKPFSASSITFRSMIPTREDAPRSWRPMLRGAGIGSFFGTLPGLGSSVSPFVSYAVETRVTTDRSRFGRGAVEGVAGPESANNAADQTAFIPTLSLGIPGSPTMALILGALIIHGITPGPQLVTENAELFWGLVMSFWVGNVLLLILNIPLIGLWVRLLAVPYHILYPIILIFISIGVYSVTSNPFDVYLTAGIGLLAYVLRLLDFSVAPVLLGYVLGPLLEENFRRAMLISRGNAVVFLERPISLAFLSVTALMVAWSIYAFLRARRSRAKAMLEERVEKNRPIQ